jgi:acetoacetyl-CoA synthetase
VYEHVSSRVFLRSTSGGTDVCTSIMGCAPILPVRAGEIQCPPLGVAVTAFDEHGHEVIGQPGELVVTRPMPSMPVGFWNDPGRRRLRAAYFEHYPGVWRHGDWVTIYEDGAGVVHGRSDATLKRGGIRIGTAEVYRTLERLDWVRDSLVVDVPTAPDGSKLVLLLLLAPGTELDPARVEELRTHIRSELSPRHVPDLVLSVPSLPRTLNGKRLEVPVKRLLMGAPLADVVADGAVTDFSALDAIASLRPLVVGAGDGR